jgi:rRNA maturation endonuclease Nob1
MSDLPRNVLLLRANATYDSFKADGIKVDVYFKFTCAKCGRRCQLADANVLYENGECDKCGHTTRIEQGGFSVHIRIGEDD